MSRMVAVLINIMLVLAAESFQPMKNSFARVLWQENRAKPHSSLSLSMSLQQLGGKVLVTGIGESEQDEFMLNLLNEQKIWTSVVLATTDSVPTKKRFLSRTARYSGLLNVLEFETADISSSEQLQPLLQGAYAWIAFNVDQASITRYANQAVDAGLKRAIFTLKLDPKDINTTVVPEFDAAIKVFTEAGATFTGIRHGEVTDGDEDNPYEIVNASIPCLEDTVERGVLARVTAELLLIESSGNTTCGVCSSSEFAAAYLNVLRSSGLTRSQEVEKIFSGGLQRVAQMTVKEYKERKQREGEQQALREKAKLEEELEEQREQERIMKAGLAPSRPETYGLSDEEIESFEPTEPEKIAKRTDEILASVWRDYDSRLITKTSSKKDFFDANRAKATELATKELEEERSKKLSELMEKRKVKETLEKFVDTNRVQYAKLLALERKEMQNQKEISDIWVKYLYLLLEVTMAHCKADGKLFHNMDEFAQTLLLRSQANALRAQCGIQPFEVVYDPLDASVIVGKLSTEPLGLELGLDRPADDILPSLEAKYGAVLKSVAALRGAAQIIELAIETLKKELPPPPPTVAQLRATESQAKQSMVAQLRLAAVKNRGSPQTGDGPSSVGRL